MGVSSLKECFPRLFQLVVCKDVPVAEMGYWQGQSWSWKWRWRRLIFAWEEEIFTELQNCPAQVQLQQNALDFLVWKQDAYSWLFTVRSAYNLLLNKQVNYVIPVWRSTQIAY